MSRLILAFQTIQLGTSVVRLLLFETGFRQLLIHVAIDRVDPFPALAVWLTPSLVRTQHALRMAVLQPGVRLLLSPYAAPHTNHDATFCTDSL